MARPLLLCLVITLGSPRMFAGDPTTHAPAADMPPACIEAPDTEDATDEGKCSYPNKLGALAALVVSGLAYLTTESNTPSAKSVQEPNEVKASADAHAPALEQRDTSTFKKACHTLRRYTDYRIAPEQAPGVHKAALNLLVTAVNPAVSETTVAQLKHATSVADIGSRLLQAPGATPLSAATVKALIAILATLEARCQAQEAFGAVGAAQRVSQQGWSKTLTYYFRNRAEQYNFLGRADAMTLESSLRNILEGVQVCCEHLHHIQQHQLAATFGTSHTVQDLGELQAYEALAGLEEAAQAVLVHTLALQQVMRSILENGAVIVNLYEAQIQKGLVFARKGLKREAPKLKNQRAVHKAQEALAKAMRFQQAAEEALAAAFNEAQPS